MSKCELKKMKMGRLGHGGTEKGESRPRDYDEANPALGAQTRVCVMSSRSTVLFLLLIRANVRG